MPTRGQAVEKVVVGPVGNPKEVPNKLKTLHKWGSQLLNGSHKDGGITEEIELICCMTGFRRRFLIHHIGEGFYRSVELEAR